MDKKILEEYVDACKLAEEIEREIQNLEGKKIPAILGKVKGSNADFPFQECGYTIHGKLPAHDKEEISEKRKLLQEQKEKAQSIKYRIEEWMYEQPMRMQRIIKYRILDGLAWEEVAKKMGRNSTGDSVRMEFNRFFQKK